MKQKYQMEDIWSKYAECYDLVVPKTSFHKELRQKTLTCLQSCQTILDIGSGTGALVEELSKEGKTVYGIDSNQQMLEVAEKRNILLINKKVFLSKQDATDVKFKDNYFEGVSSLNVLYTVNDPKKMLSEAYRVLKAKGIFVVSGPKPDANISKLMQVAVEDYQKEGIYDQLKDAIQIVEECNNQIVRSHILHTYTAESLEKILLEEIGFRKIIASDEQTYLNQSYFVTAMK